MVDSLVSFLYDIDIQNIQNPMVREAVPFLLQASEIRGDYVLIGRIATAISGFRTEIQSVFRVLDSSFGNNCEWQVARIVFHIPNLSNSEYADRYQHIGEFVDFLESMSKEEYDAFEKLIYELDLIDKAVTLDSKTRGSSLIGEGLASCLFNFPYLGDSDRTRVIIMVSDNAQAENSPPAIELAEAAQMCKNNNVAVFGIFPPAEALRDLRPDQNFDNLSSDMRQNIRKTGGEFYVVGSDFDTEDVIAQIRSHEAMQVDEVSFNKLADDPRRAIMICICGLVLFVIAKGAGT